MKKGQAAVEYLMTYGWAILALVIVMAVLFSTGIFSPSYLVSEECSFGNTIRCNFGFFNDAGSSKMLLTLYNGFPYKIRMKSLDLETTDGTQQFTGFDTGVDLESGANHTFSGTLGGAEVPEGNVKKFVGTVTYVSCAPELGGCSDVEHTITGRITAKPIPK